MGLKLSDCLSKNVRYISTSFVVMELLFMLGCAQIKKLPSELDKKKALDLIEDTILPGPDSVKVNEPDTIQPELFKLSMGSRILDLINEGRVKVKDGFDSASVVSDYIKGVKSDSVQVSIGADIKIDTVKNIAISGADFVLFRNKNVVDAAANNRSCSIEDQRLSSLRREFESSNSVKKLRELNAQSVDILWDTPAMTSQLTSLIDSYVTDMNTVYNNTFYHKDILGDIQNFTDNLVRTMNNRGVSATSNIIQSADGKKITATMWYGSPTKEATTIINLK